MDVAAQPKKPTYRQTFRQHRILLSLPMILAVLAGGYFVFSKPKTYRASTNLWVDTTPPTASSVGSNSAALPSQPASAEQSLVTELLTTNSFALSVAHNSKLGQALAADGPINGITAGDALITNVTTMVTGPQVLKISYTGSSPEVATTVVAAIVKALQQDSTGLTAQHDDAALAYYKKQVSLASDVLTQARDQVTSYLNTHPRAAANNDPNLSALIASVNAANTQYTTANTALAQASGVRDGGGWMVQVVDPPNTAVMIAQSKKKMLEYLLGALFAGFLISFLGARALAPKQPAEPWEDELRSTPAMPFDGGASSLESLVGAGGVEDSPFASERHFVFHSPADDLGQS